LKRGTLTYTPNTPNIGSPAKKHTFEERVKKRSNTNISTFKNTEENTEILRLNIHINDKELIMSLKRFDDLYVTTRNFLDSHHIPEKLIKPIVFKICEAMKNLFVTFNKSLKKFDRDYLFSLRKLSETYIHDKTIKKDLTELVETDISSFSAMSLGDSESDLSFFKLNKSF
jgi:hypothetical protein